MTFCFIGCEVLTRAACRAIAVCRHSVDPVFMPKAAHIDPGKSRVMIQNEIDNAGRRKNYDAILLGFGLCGNTASGLIARNIPLVIPRAHDCCTLFLGSRNAFLHHFGNRFSAEWSSPGYLEKGGDDYHGALSHMISGDQNNYEALVGKYGEENAQYIRQVLFPENITEEILYLRDPDMDEDPRLSALSNRAAADGRKLTVIEGNNRLVFGLFAGNWNDEYLVVKPGECIDAVYDHEYIMQSMAPGNE